VANRSTSCPDRSLWPPAHYDLALLMPSRPGKEGFETLQKAENEDDLRLMQLWKVWSARHVGSPKRKQNQAWIRRRISRKLASFRLDESARRSLRVRLEAGQSGPAPETLASSVHFRELRRQHIGGLLECFAVFDDANLSEFTLINENWLVTPQELWALRASTLVRQLRTHLERAGVNAIQGTLVAYLHGEFDPISGMFQLHFHGVATAAKAAALMRLVRKPDGTPRGWGYVRTCTGSAPICRQAIRDRVWQFSYLLKSYWPSRRITIGDDGKAVRDEYPMRIAEPIHSLVLLWLDREKVADMRLLTGCRPLAQGRLRMTAPVFERESAQARVGRSMPSTGPSMPSRAPSRRSGGLGVDNTTRR
jgi:hypothetical protein